MAGPLAGYRIVDLTQMVAGPMATMILGDQGADVIKVEPIAGGDLTRSVGAELRGLAPLFATTNRNKRSIALDLKSDRGRRALERLVATADMVVQNFRPGAMERLGLGHAELRKHRADLVYVSISGFGEKGPYSKKRVYDPLIQALSGLASVQGGSDRPRMVRVIVPDKVTALTAAQAMTAALLARERSGEGQHVRLSMLDAMVAFLWPESLAAYTFVGGDVPPPRTIGARDLIFETSDGYITAGAVSDAEWRGMATALNRPQWLEDPRFASPSARVRHADLRMELVAEILTSDSSANWLQRLDNAGVPCAPVLTREEMLTHPQVVANRLVVHSEHARAGAMRQARPAARFEATPAGLYRDAPLLGEHTVEVLLEAGLSDGEIDELCDRDVARRLSD